MFPWVYGEDYITLRLMIEDTHDIDITITRKELSLEADACISFWTNEYTMEELSLLLNAESDVINTQYVGEGHQLNDKFGECIYQSITANSLRDARISAEIWLIELMRILKVETKSD